MPTDIFKVWHLQNHISAYHWAEPNPTNVEEYLKGMMELVVVMTGQEMMVEQELMMAIMEQEKVMMTVMMEIVSVF